MRDASALLDELLDEFLMSRERAGLPLSQLLAAARCPLPAEGAHAVADPVVMGVTHDSSAVRPGDLFVAIRGQRDGADYAADAVARGAVAVAASSPDRQLGVPWILVSDDRGSVADLAAALHGAPSTKLMLFGVTGTNGKTTSATACAEILGAAGGAVGLIGTVEARWPGHSIAASRTTPEAADIQGWLGEMVDDGCAAAVLEVSSHGIDLQRVRALRFAAVGFTNLSQDHLDWHGDLETYFQSKRRLFTDFTSDAVAPPAVICIDDAWGARLATELRAADRARVIVTVGFGEEADLRIVDLHGSALASTFRLVGKTSASGLPCDVNLPVVLRLPGRHNAQNAALAAGLALATGAPPALVSAGLAGLRGVPGRLERVELDSASASDISVFVDYAHTPAALEGVLSAAREFTAGRLICVFGCGGDKDKAKRSLMGDAVGRLADIAVATSDNPRSEDPLAILAAACEGLAGKRAEIHVDADRRAAIEKAIGLARTGDVVVIAGKGHETFQEIAGRRIPFDDRVVARDILLRRSGQ